MEQVTEFFINYKQKNPYSFLFFTYIRSSIFCTITLKSDKNGFTYLIVHAHSFSNLQSFMHLVTDVWKTMQLNIFQH